LLGLTLERQVDRLDTESGPLVAMGEMGHLAFQVIDIDKAQGRGSL